MTKTSHFSALLGLLALGTATLHAGDTELPLVNPGFEKGLEGWTLTGNGADNIFKASPEAAMLGKGGLRVAGEPAGKVFLSSTPLPVTPGKSYTVSIWGGNGGTVEKRGAAIDAKMIFKGSGGEELKPAMAKIRKWPGANINGGDQAGNIILAAAAPTGATTLSLVFSTLGSPVGPVDIDDIQITELTDEPPPPYNPADGHPVPPSDPARVKMLEDEVAANPYKGKTPPKIVLKVDDFVPSHGGVHPRWIKLADFCKDRKIKINYGIIANGMNSDCAEFVKWTKAQHDAGRIEFWNHGFDHGQTKDTGKIVSEFDGQTYEYQKDHMTKANQLAREKLGFPFVAFGAPFNATDANTVKVLSEDPDIKVWMYGDTRNTAGKTVLERIYTVNIENPTLIPNYAAFLEGYVHNRGSAYFVMQGHPAGWGGDRWDQFVKIVDFLTAQKAEFVFASDLIPGAGKK